MKKKSSVFSKILRIFLLILGTECLVFSLVSSAKAPKVENASDVNLFGLKESKVVFFEELEVLERYAFQTMDEYTDSEGTYVDTTYYVYDGSHPMDKNELHSEYYIVKLCDEDGNEFITSMSVAADRHMTSTLKKCPIKISACAWVSEFSKLKLQNSNDKKLDKLEEKALNEYSEASGIPRANVTLGYKNETIKQYQKEYKRENTTTKIMMAVFGTAFIAIGAWLTVRKKKETTES